MNRLVLARSEMFQEVQCDFYQDEEGNPFMTDEQLGLALGYTDSSGIRKLLKRNPHLEIEEFSTSVNLSRVEGTREVRREIRVFTEDGIYEAAMLSSAANAVEFRQWVRRILKGLRIGQIKLSVYREIRKELTQAIRESGLEEKYSNWASRLITDYIYKMTIGKDARHYRQDNDLARTVNVRKHFTNAQRQLVARVEDAIKSLIVLGYDYEEIKKIVADKLASNPGLLS
jgi:prophage antirepressor-like protein